MYMSERDKSIDIARAFAIILVVMSHCDNFDGNYISKFSGLFFIPLFIFISGYFSKENAIYNLKDLYSHLKKKISKLYIFYFKWEVIYLVLTNIFFKIGFYNSTVYYGEKILMPITSMEVFIKKVIEIIFLMGKEPFCGAFWFIISLMFIIVGYSIINFFVNKFLTKDSIKKKQIILGIIVFLCFIVGCIMSKTINIPRLSPAFSLIVFYYFGYIANYYKKYVRFDNFLIFIASIVVLIILYNYGSVQMNKNSFPNGIYLLASSFSGIYIVMYLSKKTLLNTAISKFISFIGKNTLPIIALHFIGFKIVMVLQICVGKISYSELSYLTGYRNDNFWYILYVFSGIGFPLLCYYVKEIIKNKLIKNNIIKKNKYNKKYNKMLQ